MTSLLPKTADAGPGLANEFSTGGAARPVRKAVVLAAGAGSRLRTHEADDPKPLMRVAGVSLLERAVRSYSGLGVSEVFVVVGYQRAVLLPVLRRLQMRLGMRITPVISHAWELGNGASVLAAEPYVDEPFFLAMCDHIFEPAALDRLVSCDDGRCACALVIDRDLDAVADIEEATKVRLSGSLVIGIGKQLATYDAIDTGVFLARPQLFAALRETARHGGHTLSDAVRLLGQRGEVLAVDGTGLDWFDIDTAQDLLQAEYALTRPRLIATPLEHSVRLQADAGADVAGA